MATDVQPGFTDQAFPEVFNTVPPPPKEKKPGQLPDHLIRQFFEEGYVIVPKFFQAEEELDPCLKAIEELDPCLKAIEELVDEVAQKLCKAGKIKDPYKDRDVYDRLICLNEDFPGANILLIKSGKLPQAFRDLWSNARLLNVVEQLIGPEMAGHPVWNLRCKVPNNEETTVPWHQDAAYLDNTSYNVMQVTAWIPLLDTDEKNGCMEVAARGHRRGKVARHTCCWGETWYVTLDEEEMAKTLDVDLKKDFKLCPVPYGGMLLLNNMIPHRSLNNQSDKIRWSLDLRWQRPDLPVGFYGLKQGVLMRSPKHPNLTIDWEGFEKVDRHIQQRDVCKDRQAIADESEFDTTIQGPWMKKWEMVHRNRHTDSLMQESSVSWQQK